MRWPNTGLLPTAADASLRPAAAETASLGSTSRLQRRGAVGLPARFAAAVDSVSGGEKPGSRWSDLVQMPDAVKLTSRSGHRVPARSN